MDDCGPLYNVRMKRGQGYNSYIQEVRIDNAVTITKLQDNARTASLTGSDSETVTASLTTTASVSNAPPKQGIDMTDLIAVVKEGLKTTTAESPQQPKLPYLLKLDPNARHNQTVTFSSKQVKSVLEMNNAMGFNASAAIKATSLGPGAEAGSSLATSNDLGANDVNFLVHVKVVNEADDRKEEWSFNEVTGLNEVLSDDKDTHTRSVEFTRIYGDCFISDFVEGGEMYAWIGIKSLDRKNSRQLALHASAQLTPMALPVQASGKMDMSQERSRLFSQATTSIRIQWRGGGQIKNHDFPWGMDNLVLIANAFPSMVAAKPAKIRAVLTSYAALKSFQDHRLANPRIPLPLTYDHCAIYTSTLYEDFVAFQELCETLNDMIRVPQNYRNRDDDKTKKDSQKMALQASVAAQVPGGGVEAGFEFSRSGPRYSVVAQTAVPAGDDTETDRKTRPLMDLDAILLDTTRRLASMDPDPQKLSMMRLLCRSSMIYIQEQAAALVVDPERSITKHDEHGRHVYSLPKYVCPGVIQSILPVPKYDDNSSSSDWRVKDLADLSAAKNILSSPSNYWWDVIGEPLSQYKKYKHFAIGNFDLEDEEFPQRIAVQPFEAAWYRGRRVKDSHNAIGGIGLGYADNKSVLNVNVKTVEGNEIRGLKNSTTEEQGTMFANMYVGCKPGPERWKQIDERGLAAAPINRVHVYYLPGTGRIAGLEFLSDPSLTDGNDALARATPVFVHKAWEQGTNADSVEAEKLLDRMECQALYPGDGLSGDEIDKNWMFAGLVGAFEKVGVLGSVGSSTGGRVLAKVAVIWKRRPGSLNTVANG
ncbi:hypothetical protein PV08_07365 [Exophiala spinifera]|uniref:MACPF domain-containing protein n=1 Tax=Exophiala spinifera TaxID=91928 RepID=A0A0D1YI32_9EURO|nr:uncharacterized protein PV08_07365 [Exophiala spinifera]KIW14581.1 hypothetical protein PV08_07365 [Exophiala spinifera]